MLKVTKDVFVTFNIGSKSAVPQISEVVRWKKRANLKAGKPDPTRKSQPRGKPLSSGFDPRRPSRQKSEIEAS